MQIHNKVTSANGIISVVLQARFIGDPSDPSDKQKIAALGDPQVNLAGKNLQDPNNPSFTFSFGTTEQTVGVTTEMQNWTARFLTELPPLPPPPPVGQQPTWFPEHHHHHPGRRSVLGPLDCVVATEVQQNEAAVAWVTIMVQRITAAMAILRGQALVPAIPDSNV